MLDKIEANLKSHFDGKLVDELLASYQEAKRNFYLSGLRLSAVEGGRFCEAAFRLLDQATTGKFTGLNRKLDTEKLITQLANLPRDSHSDSIRVHIPRALRVVYDIRNNRDAAHLADGIDPNLQDATLVISVLDWVLAEFVRMYHGISAGDAQKVVDGLVTRRVPAIEDFDGFLKVLKPELKASEYVLLTLYERGKDGALYKEIEEWVRPVMRANLRRTLNKLVDDDAHVHRAGDCYVLTKLGAAEVERNNLHHVRP
jgi:hypothetical protein